MILWWALRDFEPGTRTNDIESGRYRAEFNRLRGMQKHLDKLSPSEASACCWAAEHPDLYEAAKTGMNTHHGQAPTPYGVYQRAMRIRRAKDAAAAKNAKESREAATARAAEVEQDYEHVADDRDRLAMVAHEERLKADRIAEEAQQKVEKLQAELIKVKAEHPAVAEAEQMVQAEREQARELEAELKDEMELLRREIAELREKLERVTLERDALLAEKGVSPEAIVAKPRKAARQPHDDIRKSDHGITPAMVLAGLDEVIAAHGSTPWSRPGRAMRPARGSRARAMHRWGPG